MLSGHDIEATFAMDTYEDRCRRMVNDTLGTHHGRIIALTWF